MFKTVKIVENIEIKNNTCTTKIEINKVEQFYKH